VANLDHNALVDETARFSGAQLIYANLDDITIDRIRSALGQLPLEHEPAAADDAMPQDVNALEP